MEVEIMVQSKGERGQENARFNIWNI